MIEAAIRTVPPAHYGDQEAEYEAVRGEGAGLFDLSARGRLRVSGTEAVMFLNGLITNDMKTLADGAWMKAAFPNAQGRVQAFVRVLRQGYDYLLDTEPETRAKVAQLVGRFVFAGDFRVTDLADSVVHFGVSGGQSAQIMSRVLGADAAVTLHGSSRIVDWRGQDVTVMRFQNIGTDGFDCLVAAEHGPTLWAGFEAAGAQPIGAETYERLRIEAGIPRYGLDMDENTVVLETGQDHAVSYTKGCYIGQEIIARIHWRGHVAKRLVGLQCDTQADIKPDATISTPEGQNIGRVTSPAFSPRLGCTIALGYVRYAHLAPGTRVCLARGAGTVAAQVVELPFIK
jgi:folate-binding protein YgfZ